MMTPESLTGQSTAHLVPLIGHHRLQATAAAAFLSMQQQAALAGFNLQPASSFRDFDRQLAIWNDKFSGLRPVLDANSQPLDISHFNDEQICRAILYWSALPGTSRHHWGSDLDIYDPDQLAENKKLLLEPWEYEEGGYFSELSRWLTVNMAHYGFYRPFEKSTGNVGYEPWHISYRPIAEQAEKQLTPKLLLAAWQNKEIAGYQWLSQNLDQLFNSFIRT